MSAAPFPPALSLRHELDCLTRLLDAARRLTAECRHAPDDEEVRDLTRMITAILANAQARLVLLGRVLAGWLDPAVLLHAENRLDAPPAPHDDPDLVLSSWVAPPAAPVRSRRTRPRQHRPRSPR